MTDNGDPSAVALHQLSPSALAEAGDFKTLAAVAKQHPQHPPAGAWLQELANAGSDEDAFVWFWALMTEAGSTEQRWTLVLGSGLLPARFGVPATLAEKVRSFIVNGQQDGGAQGEAARDLLLNRIDDELALSAARALMSLDDPPSGALETATLKVLCQSRESQDRTVALDHIRAMPAPQRLEPLCYYSRPYLVGEQDSVAHLFLESLKGGLAGQGSPVLRAAAAVVDTFTIKTKAVVLSDERWPADARKGAMRTGLVEILDKAGELTKLLQHDGLDEDAAADLLDVAAGLLEPSALAELAEQHHGSYPSSAFDGVRRSIAQRIGQSDGSRKPLLKSYWRFSNLAQDDKPADELAEVLESAELADGAKLAVRGTNWKRVGRIAGTALGKNTAAFQEGAVAIASRLSTKPVQHADYIVGLVTELRDLEDLDNLLLHHFALTELTVNLLCNAGQVEAAVSGAHAVKHLEDSARAAVEVIALAPIDQIAEDQLDALAELVPWTDVEYGRYVSAIVPRAERLSTEVRNAVASLPGSEALRVPTAALKTLLNQALDAGFAELPSNSESLERMLIHPDEEVVALAARWIVQSEDTSEETVAQVIKADHETSGQIEALVGARRALGARLVGLAIDPERATAQRAEAIDRARKADPDAARAAAFDLAGDQDKDKDLRAAAAEVLASTQPGPEDEPRLKSLVETEKVRSISLSLEKALRAVTTHDIDEALNQLVRILEMEERYTERLEPDVLLPGTDWRDGVINDVNDLRVANYAPDAPRNFINVACSLADTIAEQALVARNDVNDKATTLSKIEADAVRKNSPNKQDVGALLRVVLHQQTFPWFNSLIALRDYRSAHTAPRGSTKPKKLGEREYRKTLGYLEDVVEGWIKSMYETHQKK